MWGMDLDRSFYSSQTLTRPNGSHVSPKTLVVRKLHPWLCRWEQYPGNVSRILAPSYEEAAEEAAKHFMTGRYFDLDRGLIIQVQPMKGVGARTKSIARIFVEFRPLALAKSSLVRHLLPGEETLDDEAQPVP